MKTPRTIQDPRTAQQPKADIDKGFETAPKLARLHSDVSRTLSALQTCCDPQTVEAAIDIDKLVMRLIDAKSRIEQKIEELGPHRPTSTTTCSS